MPQFLGNILKKNNVLVLTASHHIIHPVLKLYAENALPESIQSKESSPATNVPLVILLTQLKQDVKSLQQQSLQPFHRPAPLKLLPTPAFLDNTTIRSSRSA
jgi:hypothetical protein